MTKSGLRSLRFFALLFLLPGLAGLIASAVVSTSYLESMPRFAAPEEQRVVARNIHGTVIYQTADEDERLNLMEYVSVSVFSLGMLLGMVYLEKWSATRQLAADDLEGSQA